MITARLSQQQFDDLAERLRVAEGITLTGTSGTVSKSGATVQWGYQDGVLRLTCTHAPWGATGIAENRLKEALVAAGVVLTPPS